MPRRTLLLVPAVVLLYVSYVEPTIWTLRASVQKHNIVPFLPSDQAASGGLTFDNFGDLFGRGFVSDVMAAFLFALVPVLVVLVAAPVLAWAAHTGGRATRWVTRGLLAFPLAGYAPSAYIAAGLFGYGFEDGRKLYWLGTFGFIASIAVTAYLTTLRRATQPPPLDGGRAGGRHRRRGRGHRRAAEVRVLAPHRQPESSPPLWKLFGLASRLFPSAPQPVPLSWRWSSCSSAPSSPSPSS